MNGMLQGGPPRNFSRVLIANRGEVALRILRAARELGLETVAVHTAEELDLPHVRRADQAVLIQSPRGYLDAQALVEAALRSGAQAVHPGYGFLAENPEFARLCADSGLRFIGPSPASIALMGNKSAARKAMQAAGLEVIAGYDGTDQSDSTLEREASRIGAPLMIKACGGGGGRGMRRVDRLDDFIDALAAARAEALAAFGSADVLLERAVDGARHIEVQILADAHGNVVSLGERDCSIQRRHQKLVEEAPSPAIDESRRSRIGEASVQAIRTLGYENAGTLEFLLSSDGRLLFMEMNTRLQVEHPVTELVYGVDLVQWQFRIASGARLDDLTKLMRHQPRGHAIEVRLCAEDPHRHFLPQSGTIGRWVPPDDIRVEHALHDGGFVAPQFDSMIAKLVAHGPDRESARRKLLNALSTLQAFGLATNRDFLIRCLRHPAFESGNFNTGFVAEFKEALLQALPEDRHALLHVAAALLQSGPSEATGSLLPRLPYPARLELNGERFEGRVERVSPGRFLVAFGDDTADVHILRSACDDTQATINGAQLRLRWWRDGDCLWMASNSTTLCVFNRSLAASVAEPSAGAERSRMGDLASPMNARVSQVVVKLGDPIRVGEVLLSLEAMKIEHQITAPVSGRIERIDVAPGSLVKLGSPLLKIAPEAA